MTWIKICGTTNLQDAQISVDAGCDALGFIFAPSPRHVEISQAAEIIARLPERVEKIGIFVNDSPAAVADIAANCGLTGVQLQGDEAPESLPEFRRALGDRKIIKTIQAKKLLEAWHHGLQWFSQSPREVDAILLDSGSAMQRGGTGVAFDWQAALPMVKEIQKTMPVIVAGGLNHQNVEEALQLFAPWGVDVVSGVEREPGRKDESKLRDFIAAVRRAQAAVS